MIYEFVQFDRLRCKSSGLIWQYLNLVKINSYIEWQLSATRDIRHRQLYDDEYGRMKLSNVPNTAIEIVD